MKQELQALTSATVFSVAMLSTSDAGVGASIGFLVLQTLVYLCSSVVHEVGHYWCGRVFGLTGSIAWWPYPSVEFGAIGRRQARVVAATGPLAGAVFALLSLGTAIAPLDISPLLYAVPFAFAAMHLGMLWPSLPDGKMLFQSQSKLTPERT